MVNTELEEIIRTKFKEGERRADIKEYLLQQGYDEAEVDIAIAHIQKDAIKQLPLISHMYQLIEDLENKTDHASPKFVAAVLAGCFTILIILFASLYFWLDPLGINTVERDKQRETDVVKLRSAIDQYYIAKKVYPAKLNDLLPTYLQSIPLDPKSGAPYDYRTQSNNLVYELCIVFEAQPSQCVSSAPTESSIPMVIVTPTPMLSEVEEELEAAEEATNSSELEAPIVSPTTPAEAAGGTQAL